MIFTPLSVPFSTTGFTTTTTLQVKTTPSLNVPSLEVKTTGITRVVSLDSAHPINEPTASYTTTTPPTTAAQSNDPFPTKAKTDTLSKVSSLERIAAQLQANQLLKSQTLEIKTEALSTVGPTLTTPSMRTSNSPVEEPSKNGNGGGSVTAQTVSKVNLDTSLVVGTGTGSVTATPTSYMTAVTTTASTTTASVMGSQDSLLGKRVRKQSTKYEDYEQPAAMVRVGKRSLLYVLLKLTSNTSGDSHRTFISPLAPAIVFGDSHRNFISP